MSVVLASALVICTPAADTFSAAGIIPGIMQKAKAASGQIDDNQKLNSDIIADATLLAYLSPSDNGILPQMVEGLLKVETYHK